MTQVNVHEAKTNLSKLLALVEAGEEVIIARGKEPVARLVPMEKPKKRKLLGAFKGQFELSDAFFEPLPDDELAAWGLD
ncbi:MAG: type II toxin-antitoxin system Phd/YefM family antitoxin [Sphingopyxis sp.]|nr:type II toxin-antitoxin system Phd/YefM family antitoxin [Sphingopyxis sp.]